MKTLSVTIKLELQVPDEWELVKTEEGAEVLKMEDGHYLDLTFEPMVAADMEDTWTNAVDEKFMDELLNMVESEDVTYELVQTQSH